ncbi:transposase family protein [Kitasatospora sp. NPDC057198]|uniref:transposase family protein n=1 Tax=Kitasatospora sp. NPDC057198 TaxID=3346046 RepID=UPI00362FA21E
MVRVDAHSRCPAAECPSCGAMGHRVHSTYRRRLADRPLGGRLIVLTLRVRRFFCDHGGCSRRTFAE